jgi:hypothetical protein
VDADGAFVTVAIRLQVNVKVAPGQAPTDQFHTADLNDPVTVGHRHAGGFGIEYNGSGPSVLSSVRVNRAKTRMLTRSRFASRAGLNDTPPTCRSCRRLRSLMLVFKIKIKGSQPAAAPTGSMYWDQVCL